MEFNTVISLSLFQNVNMRDVGKYWIHLKPENAHELVSFQGRYQPSYDQESKTYQSSQFKITYEDEQVDLQETVYLKIRGYEKASLRLELWH